MPKVTLINYTGFGNSDTLFAARVLAFTKNTRMVMNPDGFMTWLQKDEEEILKEVAYMATTIPSSWEFVDLTFLIQDVSRSTAQQITRTRTASFAMQSQRVTDMRDVTWDRKDVKIDVEILGSKIKVGYNDMVQAALDNYKLLVDEGMPLEDAREVLPIGVHCNLVAKYNLRGLVELCRARDSLRVQGPYVEVARQMKEQTITVWPWAETFFTPPNDKAISMIEEVALALRKLEGNGGAMYQGLSGKLAKASDLIKKG